VILSFRLEVAVCCYTRQQRCDGRNLDLQDNERWEHRLSFLHFPVLMGTRQSKSAPPDSRPTRSSASKLDRERLHALALNEWKRLTQTSNIKEINLFFVSMPGSDFPSFMNKFSERTGISIIRSSYEDEGLWKLLSILEHGFHEEARTSPTAAVEELLARQSRNVLMALPRSQHELSWSRQAQGFPLVRMFDHSLVEDRYIIAPLYVDGHADERLAALIDASIEVAGRALDCQCNPGSSVWIYIKIHDESWNALKASYRTNGGADEAQLAEWDAYRAKLGEFFAKNEFVRSHHALVIEVHSPLLTQDEVIDDVAAIIASFVAQQVQSGAWDTNVNSSRFRTVLSSAEHSQQSIVHARYAETMRFRQAGSAPPAQTFAQAPLELIPRSLSSSSSSTKVSSAGNRSRRSSRIEHSRSSSPFPGTRRVHSGEANAICSAAAAARIEPDGESF